MKKKAKRKKAMPGYVLGFDNAPYSDLWGVDSDGVIQAMGLSDAKQDAATHGAMIYELVPVETKPKKRKGE